MRKNKTQRIIERTNAIEIESYGETLYLRPFESDDQMINAISKATGEKRAKIAQKLIRLALANQRFDFAGDNDLLKRLDWLITNERHKSAKTDVQEIRFERLEEHAKSLEKLIEEIAQNSRFTRILVSEIYCLANICMSYLNQIFTKLIEYFSPVEVEKNNSIDFANRNILGLVGHSLTEFEKTASHHKFDLDSIEPEMLYLFTKIEKLEERLNPSRESTESQAEIKQKAIEQK
jgi:archaellum component FlaC